MSEKKKSWPKIFIDAVLFRQSARVIRRSERLRARSDRFHKRIMDNLAKARKAFYAGDFEVYGACAKRAAYLEARYQERVREPMNDLMRQVGLPGSVIDPPDLGMQWYSQPLTAVLKKEQNDKQ